MNEHKKIKKAYLLLLICLLPSSVYSQRIDTVKIYSKALDKVREFVVYTPREYYKVPNSKFEVIYVFDAQAKKYFDYVHSTISFLNNSQFPMIVVGVVSSERNMDFLNGKEYHEATWHIGEFRGNAELFFKFISEELVPCIDTTYRVLPKRIAVGHSNGATFLLYCFTQKPELFDAYLLISPNCAYHDDQPVRRLEGFDTNLLLSKKYIYMCNANEEEYWKGWAPARDKAIAIFRSKSFKNKILFENQDFSATENHMTVFPIGVLNGLKKYMNYQYYTADNLIAYYSDLRAKDKIDLNPEQLNQLAYDLYYDGKIKESIKILLWTNELFPENMNVCDSLGEMYRNQNNMSEAMRFYKLFEILLEQHKDTLPEEEYEKLKKHNSDRIKLLSNNK